METILTQLGLSDQIKGISTGNIAWAGKGKAIESISPVDGKIIGAVQLSSREDYDKVINQAQQAFREWSTVPAPKRGDVIRQVGDALRANKDALGKLVSYEMGKSLQEGWGEVQEMIDICDFAVGLSRQLYGLTMHSERPHHRMYEQYHPLGIVGIISAFNFPVAVWAWNTMLAWVCGDVCIWKPSEKTPLSAVACQKIIAEVFAKNNVPEGVSCLVIGDAETGKWMAEDKRVGLVSATGSTRMGKSVAVAVAKRLGRSLLELGGNNAMIISQDASLDLAIPSIVFGAVGTAGQRCTTTRRLIIQEKIYDVMKEKLKKAYAHSADKINRIP